ncbi:MAG: glycoside hydrolase 5 family protein, partial [Planctomycetota bacterium]
NLFADLQKRWGLIPGKKEGDRLRPGPVVRDRRNNFTSDDLTVACRDLAKLIRSIDPNHLITTGHSTPRPAAMHLLRAARKDTRRPDWTKDTTPELAEYVWLTHPDPIDVISIHYYDDGMTAAGGRLGDPTNLRLFKRIADAIGKPLFVGEIGLHGQVPRVYDRPEAIAILRKTLPVLVELKIPLTLYWTYADDRNMPGPKQYDLRYGKTDGALRLIEEASGRTR